MTNYLSGSLMQDASALGQNLGSSLGNVWMQLPQLRATQRQRELQNMMGMQEYGLRQREVASRENLNTLRGGLYTAETGLAKTKQVGEQGKIDAPGLIDEAVLQIATQGNTPQNRSRLVRAFSQLDPETAASQTIQMMGFLGSQIGKDPTQSFVAATGKPIDYLQRQVGEADISVGPDGQMIFGTTKVPAGTMAALGQIVAPGQQPTQPSFVVNPQRPAATQNTGMPPGVQGEIARGAFQETPASFRSGLSNILQTLNPYWQTVPAQQQQQMPTFVAPSGQATMAQPTIRTNTPTAGPSQPRTPREVSSVYNSEVEARAAGLQAGDIFQMIVDGQPQRVRIVD